MFTIPDGQTLPFYIVDIYILHSHYANICYFCTKSFEWKLRVIYSYYYKTLICLLI
ncbi:hypothetical protein FHS10_005312 [Mucilaginibacter dorajii]|nr:hypothetical protein [Mucilaginibacter dorajii]